MDNYFTSYAAQRPQHDNQNRQLQKEKRKENLQFLQKEKRNVSGTRDGHKIVYLLGKGLLQVW